jgi:hypothetical protein
MKKDNVVWRCVKCNEEMNHTEFIEHAQTLHKIDIKKPAQEKFLSHMDGKTWFSSTYEITVENGDKFIKTITCARGKHDMMRYV